MPACPNWIREQSSKLYYEGSSPSAGTKGCDMRVIAIVPTHNRSAMLIDTIESLKKQTHPVDILVVLDNCSDASEQVCKEAAVQYMHTKDNASKKSGAQNQALQHIDLNNYDAVLMMDDDTKLDGALIATGINLLEKKPPLAAVCSRADILPYPADAGLWEHLLWHMQNIEYGTFNAHRIETRGSIMVIHGMCALFRTSALLNVREKRGTIYREDNMTEDYELTLTLKELGWKVQASMKMHAWTDVPLSVSALWSQRIRWFRGGLDCLREKGFNRATYKDILSHYLFWVLFFVQIFIAYFIIRYGSLVLNQLTIISISLALINSLVRLKYTSYRSTISILLIIALIPDLLYTWFRIAQTLYAYYLSFFNKTQNW